MPRTKKEAEMSEDLENQELPEEDFEEEEVEYEDEDVSENDEEEVDEETEAAATLKPKSKDVPDPKSKIEVMNNVIGRMASMRSDELTKWWNSTEAQVRPGHYSGKGNGSAESNKASISAKPSDAVKESVKDDLKELFDADKSLNEEAKDRMETIFEAAVSARLMVEKEELEVQMEEQFEEAVIEVANEMEDKLDAYLNYCTEQFMEENELAIESSLRAELAEEFMGAFSNLCREYNINVPENKVDIVEALTERVEEQNELLDAIIGENNELKDAYVQAELQNAIEEVAEGLTDQESEKLMALCEDVDFDGDIESFVRKVAIIRETYFKDGHYVAPEEDDLEKVNEELNEEEVKKPKVFADPVMRDFVGALERTTKKNLR